MGRRNRKRSVMDEQARMFDGEAISTQHWILVKSLHEQEKLARDSLMRSGFEVYLPLHTVRRSDGSLTPRPFYPRYLFARVTVQVERWQAVFSSRGVCQVMAQNGRPTGLRDAFIDTIRSKEVEGYMRIGLVPGMPKCDLSAGDTVLVDGMYPGLFQAVEGRRVHVLLQLFNTDKRVTVDLSQVAPRAA